MKKNYNFFAKQTTNDATATTRAGVKPAPTFLHSAFCILLFAFCFLFSASLFAQTITPAGNPHIVRLQGVAFSVTVDNPSSIPLADLTLEAVGSTGFTVMPASVPIPTLAAYGNTVETFTVTADCGAPQEGGTITYTLKDENGIILGIPTLTTDITIDEPDFIFVKPADYQADYASTTNTYTRIWAITPSVVGVSLTHIRVVNTCTKANIVITQVELVDDALGTTVLDGTMTGVLDNTWAGGYIYNFDGSIFTQIGNGDALFDDGETIYIRETYRILTCNNANSTYTYGHGDGTDFCMSTDPFTTAASIAAPGYIPDISTRDITYPLSSTGTGTMWFTISNNSTDPNAIFFDTKVRVFANNSAHSYTRAYLVDAVGDPLPGFPDLIMTNNTPIMNDNGTIAIAGGAAVWVVSFDNLNNPAKQSDYEAIGMYDATGDGIWNNMLPGTECYIAVEWTHPIIATSCAGTLYPGTYRYANLYYKDYCGVYQMFSRAYSASGSTYTYLAALGYSAPRTAIITPENLKAGDPAELRIDEGSANSGWPSNIYNYDQYILITLPEGFDYDDTQQGFRINTAAMCDVADVVKTTDFYGIVTLTVHNTIASLGPYNYYRINIFAKGDITSDAVKNIYIEHEWAWKEDPVHYKYGCHTVPVFYRLIESYQNMTLESFEVQRMTFGWTDYLKTTRIDLTNIGSYPGVNRSVAGPYDNVDMTGTITIEDGFGVNSATDKWLIDLSYDGANEYFIFPNPAQAVAVSVNGAAPFYIDEDDILPIISTPLAEGNHYTLRVDLTPYTFTGQPLENLLEDDVITVTFKTQTVEALPKSLAQVKSFDMQVYLDENNAGAPEDKNILTNNFYLIDYKNMNLIHGTTTPYYENVTSSGWITASGMYQSPAFSNAEIFVNEFRPYHIVVYPFYECTIHALVDITAVRTRETIIGEGISGSSITTILSPSDYSVTHTGGETILTVPKELQTEFTSAWFMYWDFQGIYFCPTNTRMSAKANLLLYPSSERTDIIREATLTNSERFNPKYLYTYNLSTASPTLYPTTNVAEWDITLTNQSYWSGTDGILPNSWMSVTIPPEVETSSLSLTDGTNTWHFSNFIPYGGNKYWVQLGDLDIPNTQNFTLSCQYISCEPFEIEIGYGMSRGGYPINPDVGFVNGGETPCGSYKYLTLNAVPQLYGMYGEVISPEPNGIYNPERYGFCEDHEFGAVFHNTNVSALYNPVLDVILGVGVDIDELSVEALQNGASVTIKEVEIIPTGATFDVERTVRITLDDGTVLQPYGDAEDQITVTFNLQMLCGFNSGSVVYMHFSAENVCGTEIGETKNSVPIYIDGVPVTSNYAISSFTVTGEIDIAGATAMAASEINITGIVTLVSDDQQDDFISLSIPQNMVLTDNNSGCGLVFVFSRVEAGYDIYQAYLPTDMQKFDECTVDVTFAPENPGAWECGDVMVKIYTGATVPMVCDGTPCNIEEKHNNETFSAPIPVTKVDVSFLTGSITATGSYYNATNESVRFMGRLRVPEFTDLDDLNIELFTNKSGDLLPVASNPDFHVIDLKTGGGETEFPFISSTTIVPAEDMCNLWLVIRKASNPYICEDAEISLPAIGFNLTNTEPYDICPGEPLSVGDEYAITGYTYSWSPDTYINGSNSGTPVEVEYPASLIGDQYLTLSVSRGGCMASTMATVRVTETATAADINLENQNGCIGETVTLTPTTDIDNPTFRWYVSNTAVSYFHEGDFYTTPTLTTNLTVFVSVMGDDVCENEAGERKEVTVRAHSSVTGTDTQDICGTSYTWIDGNTYTSATSTPTHTITGGAVNGCDSIVTLNLTFRTIATGTDTQDICGTSYTWIDGTTYTSPNNTATHTIPNGAVNGCDSIVTLNLTFREIATGTDTQDICGTSYTWIDGNTYTSATSTPTHTIPNGAVSGCDSIVTLNLTFRAIATGTDTQDICGTSYTWIDGNTYTSATSTPTHTITGGAVNGCDSIVTLNLTFREIATGTDRQDICGSSYTWIDGNTYTSSNNTATHTISNGAVNGCDSIVTLDLTLRKQATAADIDIDDDAICFEETVTLTPTTDIDNPTFRWYVSNTAVSHFHEGASYTTSVLSLDTTIYISVLSDDVCENLINTRKAVTVTVHGEMVAPTVNNPLYAYPNTTVDLEDAVVTEPGLTYRYYENADKTGLITGSTITFNVTKTDYYVNAIDGDCESEVTQIEIESLCPVTVTVIEASLTDCAEVASIFDLTSMAETETDGELQFSENDSFTPLIETPETYSVAANDSKTIYVRSYDEEYDCFSQTETVTVTVYQQPIIPVIVVNPLLADPGQPADLSEAVDIETQFIYTYYENSDLSGLLSGSVIIFPEDALFEDLYYYYVVASNEYCQSDPAEIVLKRRCPATVEDNEENIYKVTSLAKLCWTENLKSTLYADGEEIPFAKPYYHAQNPDSEQYKNIFGLLYSWYSAVGVGVGDFQPLPTTVQGICPDGWHIPSHAEWGVLNQYPAQNLKSTLYWLDPPGPGTDNYGFDARPAGWYDGALDRFADLYGYAGWWASDDTGSEPTANHFWITYYCDIIQQGIKNKADGLSVRCVMDY